MGVKVNKNGTVTIDYRDKNGKRHRETFVGSKTLGKEVLAKRKTEISEENFFPERKKKQLTFEEAADKYWEIHLSQKKSAGKLKYTLNYLKKYFGKIPLSSLTTEKVQQFYNERMAQTSPSTANRHFTTLRAVINKVLTLKLYKGVNPCLGVVKQKENPARTRYLSFEEAKELILQAPVRSQVLFACAIGTGMRRGEILNMDWQHIDWKTGMIYIYESKSGNKREVPMSPHLKDNLLRFASKTKGKVFHLTIPMIEHDFEKTLKKCNITGVRFHDLRHTFASHFIMNGGSIPELQRILGHSSVELTNRYAHLSPTYLRKSIMVINNLIPMLGEKGT